MLLHQARRGGGIFRTAGVAQARLAAHQGFDARGHEGPGASLLRLGDVPLIHAYDDARFALLGGSFVGEGALLRFYVLHCVGLPLGIAVLMAVHFWRVRKDGGISGPL